MNRFKKPLYYIPWLPNSLKEYMSQFSDTNMASQRCYIKLFDENLVNSTAFGDHSLVHYIRIAVCNKKYLFTVCNIKLQIIGQCHVQEMSHMIVASIILHIQVVFQCLWLHQHGITCTHVISHRLMGCHTKRSITNVEVTPTDITLIWFECIVFILIIISILFSTKGAEQLVTNSWGLRISILIHRIMKDRTARWCISNCSLLVRLVNYWDGSVNKLL